MLLLLSLLLFILFQKRANTREILTMVVGAVTDFIDIINYVIILLLYAVVYVASVSYFCSLVKNRTTCFLCSSLLHYYINNIMNYIIIYIT